MNTQITAISGSSARPAALLRSVPAPLPPFHPADVIEQFRNAIRDAGLTPPRHDYARR